MVSGSKEKWAGGRARQRYRQSSREVLLYQSNHNQRVKPASNETKIFNSVLNLLMEECLDSLLFLKHLPLWFSWWRETFQKLSPSHIFPPAGAIQLFYTSYNSRQRVSSQHLKSQGKRLRVPTWPCSLSLLNTCSQHARQGSTAAKKLTWLQGKCLFTALAQDFLYISSN